MGTNTVIHENEVIGQLHEIAGEAKAESDGLTARAKKAQGSLDNTQLTAAVQNLASILADHTGTTFTAHADMFNWSKEVDDDIDSIKEELDTAETVFLPEDAARLSALLVALSQNLRAPTSGDDDVPEALKKQIEEAIAFISENTLADDEPAAAAAGGEDDDDDGDDE